MDASAPAALFNRHKETSPCSYGVLGRVRKDLPARWYDEPPELVVAGYDEIRNRSRLRALGRVEAGSAIEPPEAS